MHKVSNSLKSFVECKVEDSLLNPTNESSHSQQLRIVTRLMFFKRIIRSERVNSGWNTSENFNNERHSSRLARVAAPNGANG